MKKTALIPLLTLASVLLALGADYPGAVLQDKPAGYWRLGEADGTTVTNLGSFGRRCQWGHRGYASDLWASRGDQGRYKHRGGF